MNHPFYIYYGKQNGFEVFDHNLDASGFTVASAINKIEVDTYEIDVKSEAPLFRWSRTQLSDGQYYDILGMYAFSLDNRNRRGYHAVSFILTNGAFEIEKEAEKVDKKIKQLLEWIKETGLNNAESLKKEKQKKTDHTAVNSILERFNKNTQLVTKSVLAFVKVEGRPDIETWCDLIRQASKAGYTDVYSSAANAVEGTKYQPFTNLQDLDTYAKAILSTPPPVTEQPKELERPIPPEDKTDNPNVTNRLEPIEFTLDSTGNVPSITTKGSYAEYFIHDYLYEIVRLKPSHPKLNRFYGREEIPFSFSSTKPPLLPPWLWSIFKERRAGSIVAISYYEKTDGGGYKGICYLYPYKDYRVQFQEAGEGMPTVELYRSSKDNSRGTLAVRTIEYIVIKDQVKLSDRVTVGENLAETSELSVIFSIFKDKEIEWAPLSNINVAIKPEKRESKSEKERNIKASKVKPKPTIVSSNSFGRSAESIIDKYLSYILKGFVLLLIAAGIFFLVESIPSDGNPITKPRNTSDLPKSNGTIQDDTLLFIAPDPIAPPITLTLEQQQILSNALRYCEETEHNIITKTPNGVQEIVDRMEIERYKSELGSLPQTNEVVITLTKLYTLNETYYLNGYRKDEYSLIKHTVKEGENLYQLSQKYSVTEDEIKKYNPNDTANGTLKNNAKLVIYRKWKQ